MFIGHYAVGFAARAALGKRFPKTAPSLGTFFLAAQWVDLIWPLTLLTGLEQVRIAPGNTAVTPLDFVHYPYTHSLLAGVVWALMVGGVWWLQRRRSAAAGGAGQAEQAGRAKQAALWVGAAVLSHWVLDFLTHRPDLPLYPGGVKVGLGLWYSLSATLAVEGALFVIGALWYLRTTRAKNNRGRWGLWALLAFLVVVYVSNLLGPPPPSAELVSWSALALWLLVAWGYWIDRNREQA